VGNFVCAKVRFALGANGFIVEVIVDSILTTGFFLGSYPRIKVSFKESPKLFNDA
jgi:hypothetical protein